MGKKSVMGMLIMLALAALLAGCGKPGPSAGLAGTHWVLQSLNGRRPLAGAQITLAFEREQLKGSAGCNSYGGAYAVEGEDRLTFSGVYNTEMACLEPEGIMEQEAEYLEALRGATGFRVGDAELHIFSAGGGVLVYSRAR